jgi:hypothetical protein
MIYTAPCVRFLIRADRLRGEVGGLALEIESYVGPSRFPAPTPPPPPRRPYWKGPGLNILDAGV